MNKVIKGKKYILAGNFLPEYKEKLVKDLEKELKIDIVAVITSDYTHFIEYSLSDVDKETIKELKKLNRDLLDKGSKALDELETLKVRYNDLLRKYKTKKRWF